MDVLDTNGTAITEYGHVDASPAEPLLSP